MIKGVHLTEADLLEAARLNFGVGVTRLRVVLVIGGFVLAAGIFSGYVTATDRAFEPLWALAGVAMTLAYIAGLFGLIFALRVPAAVRRQWRENKLLQEPYDVSWQDGHYRCIGASSRSDAPWSYYHYWRETPNLMLFYISAQTCQICPKRWFDGEQLADLRRTIAEAGLARRKRFLS